MQETYPGRISCTRREWVEDLDVTFTDEQWKYCCAQVKDVLPDVRKLTAMLLLLAKPEVCYALGEAAPPPEAEWLRDTAYC
ncbi:hypothetical protein NDU88_002201 [Pleurodeles waltl]|uniref:Uncharacterized protein n=1 Tax=Pleurodeles waltl TaxID=8319 RepID=A0AAV7M1Q7_PLEWA|nr:hypothetical protein NDU88_002201 [Pleurodeles waltl]